MNFQFSKILKDYHTTNNKQFHLKKIALYTKTTLTIWIIKDQREDQREDQTEDQREDQRIKEEKKKILTAKTANKQIIMRLFLIFVFLSCLSFLLLCFHLLQQTSYVLRMHL